MNTSKVLLKKSEDPLLRVALPIDGTIWESAQSVWKKPASADPTDTSAEKRYLS